MFSGSIVEMLGLALFEIQMPYAKLPVACVIARTDAIYRGHWVVCR